MSLWPKGAHKQHTAFGGLTRSQLMSRIRSRGNKTTELYAVSLLKANGITGWRRHAPLVGRPDFIWPTFRVALFVDGCFWHGHNCGRNLRPKTNAALWQHKIAVNKARDRQNDRALRLKGWKVIRLWECTLKRNPKRCLQRISASLRC